MKEAYGNLLKELGVGDEFTIDGITFKIINPLKVDGGKGSNENSLVVAFEYEGKRILLTGDCELNVLTDQLVNERCFDYVIAPHHGSRKSFRKSIYCDLETKAVFFSVGKNPYGHPEPEIINDLVESSIPYYRTDENGTIILRIDKGITIEPTY